MFDSIRFLIPFLGLASLTAQTPEYLQFGVGCAGTVGVPFLSAPNDLPVLGEAFTAELSNLPENAVAVGILGLSHSSLGGFPLPLNLGILGMPGCFLYTDSRRTYSLSAQGNTVAWDIMLPLGSEWMGRSFYQQAMVLDAGAGNALGLIASNAGEGVIGSGQDLYWTSSAPGLSSSNVNPGVMVDYFPGTVGNQGSVAIGAFTYVHYMSSDPVINEFDTEFGSGMILGLAPGASATLPIVEAQIPIGLGAGQYWIGTLLDTEKVISESDEDNNATSTTFTVDGMGPDLTISGGSVPGAKIAIGRGMILTPRRVTNQGNRRSDQVTEVIYLSTDPEITVDDRFLGQNAVGSLGPGNYLDLALTAVGIPIDLPTGDYWIGSMIDAYGVVNELDETNNTYSVPVTVVVPDLDMVSSFSSPPNPVLPGEAVVLPGSYTVRNSGNADSGAFKVGVYLSQDAEITMADVLLASIAEASLAPGSTSSRNGFSVTIPGSMAPGPYYIGVLADHQAAVVEQDKSNNWKSQPFVVDGPDLIVTMSNPGAGPATVTAGGTVYIQPYVLTNQGGAAANGFVSAYLLSTDAVIERGVDTVLGGITNGLGLAANSSHHWPARGLQIPAGTPPGQYWVGIFVDSTLLVTEIDEGNNWASWPIMVQ